jgi:hypothetical protein
MKKQTKNKEKSKLGETQFLVQKDYNFGIYKMDPSVNVLTKTKTDF